MRARADAKPVAVAPVAEVVQRALARPRPVRDLVVAVAAASQNALGQTVQARHTGVVGLRGCGPLAPALEYRPTAAGPVRDRSFRVETQLERIARDVVGPERDRRFEIALPVSHGLPRPAKDEVEIDVEPRVASCHERGRAVLRLVRPAKCPQSAGVEALRAERDPRDAELEPGAKPLTVEGRRIDLDRRLAWAQIERLA